MGRLPCPAGCNVDDEVEESGMRKGRVLLTSVWKDASQIQMGQGEDEGHSKLEQRSTSTPSTRDDIKKTFLEIPEETQHGVCCNPGSHLQAAGAGAKLDERISSVRTRWAEGELFSKLFY